MHKQGTPLPTGQGTPLPTGQGTSLAKDAWLAGTGLGLIIDDLTGDRDG